MEQIFEIQTSKDSNILAYGTATNPRARFYWIGGGILAGLILLTVGFFLALRPSFDIPKHSVLLLSVSPRTAAAFPSSVRGRLPPLWRSALNGTSGWQVVLGEYRDENGWHSFAMVPRWRSASIKIAGAKMESRGLVSFAMEDSVASETEPLRYTDTLGWWKSALTSELTARIDPQGIGSADVLERTDAQQTEPFTASYRRKILTINLPFKNAKSQILPKQSDISLILSDEPTFGNLIDAFLEDVRLGNLNLAKLNPKPAQINIELDEQNRPTQTILSYPASITVEQAKTLLAGFGLTETHITQLPDGTIATEETPPIVEGQPPLSIRKTSNKFGQISVENTDFQTGTTTHILSDALPACAKFEPWAHFSNRALSLLFLSLDLHLDAASLPSIQLGARNGKLTACLE